MNAHFEVRSLLADIERLKLEYPDLADDDQLRADVFEGETEIIGVLSKLLNISMDAGFMASAVTERMKANAERKARFERQEEMARKLMQTVMERAGQSKLVLTEATLSITHYPPKPIVTDESQLPEGCWRVKREPNLTAIKERIKAGETIPGVGASNGYSSLTIRAK